MSLRERWSEEDKSDHETTLRELAEKLMHQSASSGAHGLSVPVVARGVEEAAACLAGADALRRGAAQLLVLKCAERACDADNMDAALDYVREAIRQIAPTEPTR